MLEFSRVPYSDSKTNKSGRLLVKVIEAEGEGGGVGVGGGVGGAHLPVLIFDN